MIIKKFQAETETEAILLAREELGKNAIVMNIRTVKPKGFYKIFRKPQVEITAAVDDNVSYGNDPILSKMQQVQNKAFTEVVPENPEGQTTAIEKKLDTLQDLLEKQMLVKEEEKKEEDVKVEKKVPVLKHNDYIQLIYNQLLNNEVDEKYANQIINEIEKLLKNDATVDNILANIYQKIILKLGQPKEIQLEENKTKYIFFIGPTGVGKTTTIAKIASSLKLGKKAKIGLVTSDTYRIAAVEQLRTYGNILGLPLKVVYSNEDMKAMKEEYQGFDIVLIDTAGRSHRNKEQRDDMEQLIHAIPEDEREVYLVLSITTKYRDLIKIAEAYAGITEYRLIFTKLDETSCIGNMLNIRMLTNASLSYSTWGQNVPEDIGKVDAQAVAKQLLGGH